MKRLIIISLILASCQKEIPCPWQNCDQPPVPVYKCKYVIDTLSRYDMNEANLGMPSVVINGWRTLIHTDYYDSLAGKDSITINLPSEDCTFDIIEKFYYDSTGGKRIYGMQIGGYASGGWGPQGDTMNYKTYFVLPDSATWASVVRWGW